LAVQPGNPQTCCAFLTFPPVGGGGSNPNPNPPGSMGGEMEMEMDRYINEKGGIGQGSVADCNARGGCPHATLSLPRSLPFRQKHSQSTTASSPCLRHNPSFETVLAVQPGNPQTCCAFLTFPPVGGGGSVEGALGGGCGGFIIYFQNKEENLTTRAKTINFT
jgi:hypothetical protein